MITVSISAVILYFLILGGSFIPDETAEELQVAVAVLPESANETTSPAPSQSPSTPAPVSSPLPAVTSAESVSTVLISQYATLGPGDDNPSILDLRKRLEELGYMESDEPSSLYNDSVEAAVELFQRVSGKEVTGIADAALQALLYSNEALPYRLLSGDSGSDIAVVQARLKELGYYTAKTSGYFGPQTKEAVLLFEYRNGLVQDGILSLEDRKQLFSFDAGKNLSPDSHDSSDAGETITIPADISYSHSAEGLGLAVSDQIDKPYVWGKDGPDAFDCSGLISYCLRLCGVSVNKADPDGYSQIDIWPKIEKAGFLKKGDLVFFKSDATTEIVHAGISIGASYFIHASSSRGKVTMSSLSEPYWERNFVFGRRIFNG